MLPNPGFLAVMEKVTQATSTAATISLDPYAQLIRALLPRTSGMSVFNERAELIWSSETLIDATMRELVAESLRTASIDSDSSGQLRAIEGAEPLYVFWLRRDAGARAGAIFAVILIRYQLGTAAEPRSFSFLHGLIKPALECLRRELLAREEILLLQGSATRHATDLDKLMAASGLAATESPEATDDLREIVRSAAEQLGAGLGALIIPEKGLVLVQTAGLQPLESSLVAKVHRHLLSTAQMRRETLLANRLPLATAGGTSVYHCLSTPVLGNGSEVAGVLALFRAASEPEFDSSQVRLVELVARRIRAAVRSSYDTLSGLLTPSAFASRFEHHLRNTPAGQGAGSLVYINVDRMHIINDTAGMHLGDRLIAQLGELIRRRLPPGASAARLGGDRFALAIPAPLAAAAHFAESLREGAEALGIVDGASPIKTSISAGVAAIAAQGADYRQVLAAAEAACRKANELGRNRVEVWNAPEAGSVAAHADGLESEVQSAVAEGRLRVYAQMLMPLSNRMRTPHFELLLRMLNRRGEVVGPDSFFSTARRNRLMADFDRWVLSQALSELRPHSALLIQSSAVITLNISALSLQQRNFGDELLAQIAASQLPAGAFCVEFPESVVAGNLESAEQLMRRLRGAGCGVALDDFGAGNSSLDNLRSLPVSVLKIDGSFVRDSLKDAKAEAMVAALAQIARSMNLISVAEHVETDAIRERIAGLGVDYAQGFAIGQPMPLSELLEQLPLYAAAAEPSGIWRSELAQNA
jgi:diguanylate cyclase (GGDEF)-like protein